MPAIEVQQLEREFKGGLQRRRRHRPRGRRRARSTASSAPTAPARRRPSGCSSRCCARPAGRARVAGHRRRHRAATQVRRRIGVALQEAGARPADDRPRADGAAGDACTASRRATSHERAARAARARRARARPPTAASAPTRAACAAGSTSPWRSSTSPRCCSSTSRPPGLDPRQPARRSGTRCGASTTRARPSSSPRSTSRRPTSSPTASGSSTSGRIVAEGTPAALKAEVGRPHLDISFAERRRRRRRRASVMARFGEPSPGRGRAATSRCALARRRGRRSPRSSARSTRPACRVESLELVQPTLDDVFVEKTGRHLEGADEAARAGARTASPSPRGRA